MKYIIFPSCTAILFFLNIIALNASQSIFNDVEFIEKFDNRSFDEIVIAEPSNIAFSSPEDEIPFTSTEDNKIADLFNGVFGDGSFTKINDIAKDLQNVSLPAGISFNQEGYSVKIAVIKAYFAPEYIQMDMLAEITLPGGNGESTKLRLGAWNIRSYYNEGWRNEVKFVLLENANIPLGEHLALSLNGCGFNPKNGTCGENGFDNATYFYIDCNGIEHAKVFFRGKIGVVGKDLKIYNVTMNNDGTFDPLITGDDNLFEIDFNVEGSLSSFYFELANTHPHYFTYGESDIIVGFEGFTLDFDVNKTNQDLMKSSKNHIEEHFGTNPDGDWQGLYIKNLSLYFPDKLTSEPERFMLNSYDLVIDQNGIAFGMVIDEDDRMEDLNFQKNLPVQLSRIELWVSKNNLNEFKIDGRVNPAFLEKGQSLSFCYDGTSDQKDVTIAYLDTADVLNTSFIPATINSFSCKVSIPTQKPYVEDFPSLTISMILVTTGKLQGLILEGEEVVYNLHTNSFDSGTASINIGEDPQNAEPNFNDFPIASTVGENPGNNFKVEATFNPNNNIDLDLYIVLSTKGDETKIGGSGSFNFDYSLKTDANGDARFINSLTVSEIQVGIETKSFAFNGGVRFYDPIKDAGRSGFSGNVAFALATKGDLEIDKKGNYVGKFIEATARVEFGTQEVSEGDVFNYWSLTASVIGIRADIIPEALIATGAAIAVSNRMDPKGPSITSGKTPTGDKIRFTPDKDKGLFVLATLFLDVVEKGTGDASFFALFGPSWNPLFMGFMCNFELMVDVSNIVDVTALESKLSEFAGDTGSDIVAAAKNIKSEDDLEDGGTQLQESLTKKTETDTTKKDYPNNEAHVKFSALLQVDFEAVELQMFSTVSLQVGNVITGNGNIYLFASAKEFYIHAGYKHYDFVPLGGKTGPFKKYELFKIDLTAGNIVNVRARAYFAMGDSIPLRFPSLNEMGITAMPALGQQKYNELNGGVTSGSSSEGITFGAAFQATAETPDNRYIDASYSVYAGALFSFQKYRNMQCEGYADNFGINKWYGEATAFAGINAEINANVRFAGKSRSVNVAGVELGTFLAAEFPNPSWFYGTAFGQITVLGFFESQFEIPVELGNKCTMVYAENTELNVEIINAISIENNDKTDAGIPKVEPYEEICIDFNYPFNETNRMESIDDPDKKRRYMLNVEDIGVKTSSDGEFIYGNSADIQVVQSWSSDKRKLTIMPKDGRWGAEDSGIEEVSLKLFVTVYRDPFLSSKRIENYCEDDELKVFNHTNECTYLIDTLITFNVTGASKTLIATNVSDSYPIIGQNYFFVNQTSSQGAFLKIEHQEHLFEGDDKNIKAEISDGTATQTVDATYEEGILSYTPELEKESRYTVNIINEDAAGSDEDPKILFSYEFGTSKYDNFAEKVAAIQSVLSMYENNEHNIYATCEYGEPFDAIDLYGSMHSNNQALVSAEALVCINDENLSFECEESICDGSNFGGLDRRFCSDLYLELFYDNVNEYILHDNMRTMSVFPFVYDLRKINNLSFDIGVSTPLSNTEDFSIRMKYAKNAGNPEVSEGIVNFKYRATEGSL